MLSCTIAVSGIAMEVYALAQSRDRIHKERPMRQHQLKRLWKRLHQLQDARVRRPTDNALAERFFGTAKQEEIHIVGSYPNEHSARCEIGRYINFYNTERPHQSLWNFTPGQIHEVNNTLILEKLVKLKRIIPIRDFVPPTEIGD
jgi:hypothetical protein